MRLLTIARITSSLVDYEALLSLAPFLGRGGARQGDAEAVEERRGLSIMPLAGTKQHARPSAQINHALAATSWSRGPPQEHNPALEVFVFSPSPPQEVKAGVAWRWRPWLEGVSTGGFVVFVSTLVRGDASRGQAGLRFLTLRVKSISLFSLPKS